MCLQSRRMKLRWLKFRVVDEETLLQWLAAAGWGTDFALTLLRQALKQQPSVSLYLSYVRHLEAASGNVLENAGVAHVRAAWEEAVSEFQLHALEAPRLWMGYRAFEMQIQQLLQLKKKQLELQVEERLAGGAASQSKENSSSASPPVPPALLEAVSEAAAAVSAQNRRIRRLFFRQLQLPLGGLGDLLDEYRLAAQVPFESSSPLTQRLLGETRGRRKAETRLASPECLQRLGSRNHRQRRRLRSWGRIACTRSGCVEGRAQRL